MTTKVTITCQENSHWDLVVITQDKNFTTGEWETTNYMDPVVLGPGQSTEHMYVHDSRRYIVEEKVRQ